MIKYNLDFLFEYNLLALKTIIFLAFQFFDCDEGYSRNVSCSIKFDIYYYYYYITRPKVYNCF
jgi:hypothetical protein